MSSSTRPRAERYRRASGDDAPRSRFRRPKHLAGRAPARHRKQPENDLTRPRHLARFAALAAITVLVAIGVRSFAIQLFYIPSASMEPTLCGGAGCEHGNDRILVNKLSYKLHQVERSDIVVFDRPHALDGVTADKVLVKRVIAIGGDTIKWSGETVWLNNIEQNESYVNPQCADAAVRVPPGQVTLAKDQVFLMGDNRCNSEDSRYFGPVATSTIVGKAFVIVWPIQRVALL